MYMLGSFLRAQRTKVIQFFLTLHYHHVQISSYSSCESILSKFTSSVHGSIKIWNVKKFKLLKQYIIVIVIKIVNSLSFTFIRCSSPMLKYAKNDCLSIYSWIYKETNSLTAVDRTSVLLLSHPNQIIFLILIYMTHWYLSSTAMMLRFDISLCCLRFFGNTFFGN